MGSGHIWERRTPKATAPKKRVESVEAQNALTVLALAGREDVPVYLGAELLGSRSPKEKGVCDETMLF